MKQALRLGDPSAFGLRMTCYEDFAGTLGAHSVAVAVLPCRSTMKFFVVRDENNQLRLKNFRV